MEKFIDKVRKLIEDGDLESALDRILVCLAGKNTRLHNEATLHKSSLSQNNRSLRQGIITNDEASRVRARINLAVLSLLIEIEKEGIKCGDERGAIINPGTAPGSGIILEYTDDKIKILFLGANPLNKTRLRIDKELREIEIGLRMSKERENILLSERWAVTASMLQQAILDENPNIIHFSGHGTEDGIMLEDSDGNYQFVPEQALENLFSLFSDTVKCVILNACYSEIQARAISKHIQYVIGMSSAIPDETAISFSVGFYKALGAGKGIEFAYKLGVNSVQLEGLTGDEIPQLIKMR